mmetsp:Transcript_22934/g.90946  ORF Transcript_22934/g.90946 Transcript_22934/m.90946 type:complete len:281 (-) Transcript_22934:420-1262(-)
MPPNSPRLNGRSVPSRPIRHEVCRRCGICCAARGASLSDSTRPSTPSSARSTTSPPSRRAIWSTRFFGTACGVPTARGSRARAANGSRSPTPRCRIVSNYACGPSISTTRTTGSSSAPRRPILQRGLEVLLRPRTTTSGSSCDTTAPTPRGRATAGSTCTRARATWTPRATRRPRSARSSRSTAGTTSGSRTSSRSTTRVLLCNTPNTTSGFQQPPPLLYHAMTERPRRRRRCARRTIVEVGARRRRRLGRRPPGRRRARRRRRRARQCSAGGRGSSGCG